MAKKIIITLYKSELIYDVQNKVHLTARSRAHAQGPALTANMQVNDAEEEQNRILRSLGDAFNRMLSRLSPYYCSIPEQKQAPSPCPSEQACGPKAPDEVYLADNIMMGAGKNREFTVPLTMPDNFNEVFTGAVTSSLHGYLVNTAVAEWFLLVSPADAAIYGQAAELEIERARVSLHARIKPLKREVGVF